jgi:hypothetical protein
MDDALAQWLALREPVDTAARSVSLTRALVDALAIAGPLQVLDLATGTGSNLRYLANRLPGNQHWLVVDRSPTLLTEMPARTVGWAATRGYAVVKDASGFVIRGQELQCRVETRQMNLEVLEAREFDGRQLVTGSALLDLVSEQWLRSLASRCKTARASALFTITYNGRSDCSPVEPEDALVLELFNRHQRTDKGLGGPAAGPDATAAAERCFAEAGYRVRIEPSDWVLGSAHRELQRQLIEGWAAAAADISPSDATIIARWKDRRHEHVDADRSRIIVGHHDLAAWPP